MRLDSLSAAIDFGLADPSRAFWLYLGSVRPWRGAILAFTLTGELVLGVGRRPGR